MRAVGQDRRPGRCRRCARPGPRSDGRWCGRHRRRLPAALPRRPGSRAGRGPRRDGPARARSVGALGVDGGHHRRRRRGRLSTAPRRPSAGLRSTRVLRRRGRRFPRQRVAVRSVLPGRARGHPGRRTAARRAAPARLAGGPRGRHPRVARPSRSDPGSGRRRHDAPQPRLPRLDAERRPRPARAAAGRRGAGPEPRRHRPAGRRHRGGRHRQHRLAGLRSRGADAGVRDGPRRAAPLARRPVHRDPQRPRHGGLGPGDRCGPGGAVLAGRPERPGRLSGRPPGAQRVRSGRRRPGPRA